jgi:hypothetical protein
MAKKPAAKAAAVEELPPAMDYAQHNATYAGFMQMVKWGCISAAVIAVALYCFIEGQQPLIGGALLLLLPIGAVVLMVTNTRRT